MTFGEQLKQWRISHNLTIEEVAMKLGVVKETVYKWERSAIAPRIGKVKFINRLLNTNFTRGDV